MKAIRDYIIRISQHTTVINHPIPDGINRHIMPQRLLTRGIKRDPIQHRIGVAHRRELRRSIRIRTDSGVGDLASCGGAVAGSIGARGKVDACDLGAGGAGEVERCGQSGESQGAGFARGGADDVARGKALDGYGCVSRSLLSWCGEGG